MLPSSNYFQTDQKERDDGRNRSLERGTVSHQPQPRNDVRPRCACSPSPRSLSDAGPLVVSALRGGEGTVYGGCVAAILAFVAVALLLMVLQPPLVRRRYQDSSTYDTGRLSLWSVLIWSSVAATSTAGLVYLAAR